jgi:hypothetical protein
MSTPTDPDAPTDAPIAITTDAPIAITPDAPIPGAPDAPIAITPDAPIPGAPDAPIPGAPGGFLSPRPESRPTDRCFRCGKPTAAGVGLCAEHNPHRLKGPSSTQMHATVFGGIVIGVVGFFILARLATGSAGPFESRILASAADGAGGVAVTFTITNAGTTEGAADCRVTRDGVPRPDDVAIRSPILAAGETVTFERQLTKDSGDPVGYIADALNVICT